VNGINLSQLKKKNLELFHHDIQVKPEHIDEMKHVNNVVYLQWVQDAAYAHWVAKAPVAMREQYNWVVLKHEIEYKGPAFLNDELIAKTWVRNYEGVRSTRVVQIYRKKDNKLLTEARSLWCLVLSSNGRPTRIGEDIKSVFLAEVR
jgi:acyl-CoA thioester hydrolase